MMNTALYRGQVARASQGSQQQPDKGWTSFSYWSRGSSGAITLATYLYPAFKQSGGAWVKTDPTVRARSDPAQPYSAEDAVRPIRFGAQNSRLLELELDGGPVTVSAPGLAIGPPLASSTGVTYSGIAPSTDLQYAVNRSGVDDNIIIRSPNAPRQFTFHFADPKGQLGAAHLQKDGSYRFDTLIDSDLGIALAPPMAYEQAQQPSGTPPVYDRRSAHMSLDKSGNGFDVTVAVDSAWLQGKSYPIVLDPYLYFTDRDGSLVAGFSADAPYSCGTACGLAQSGNLGATDRVDTTGTYDEEPGRSFYRFDLSSIPQGSTISESHFQQELIGCPASNSASNYPCNQNNYTVDLQPMTGPWDGTATWASLSSLTGSSILSSMYQPAYTCYYCGTVEIWNGLASTVQGWVQQPWTNNGFVAKLHTETSDVGGVVWAYRNSGLQEPVLCLHVTFTAPPVDPSTLAGGGSASSNLQPCSQGRDPVNCATGSFWHTLDDLDVPGRGAPLQLTQTYDSSFTTELSSLGNGWTDSYDVALTRDSAGDERIRQENGATVAFGLRPGGCSDGIGYAPTTLAAGNGGSQTLAIDCNGKLWAWGDNFFGELGIGSTANYSTRPVQVSSLSDVIGAAGGSYHSMALTSDGTVWTWGDNSDGELGNGNTTNSNVPVHLSSINSISAISGGDLHSLALRYDGTVWAWGLGAYGELGTGNTVSSSVPVQVPGLSGVVAIAAAGLTSLALKADGTVWAWGYNAYGQVGNGTTANALAPVQVFSGASAIAGGVFHSLAVKSDGTVWDWGYNAYGQLGNGTTTNSSVPVQVTGLTGVTGVAGGSYHSLAVKSDSSVWAWGMNANGQLGNNSYVNSATPVQSLQAGTLAPVGATVVTAGGFYSFSMTQGFPPAGWGYNASGQLGNGNTTTEPAQGGAAFSSNTAIAAPGGGYIGQHARGVLVKEFNGVFVFYRNTDRRFFYFTSAGQLYAEGDTNGYVTTLTYNTSGQLATVTDPAGRALNFTYNGSHLTSVSDVAGRTVSFGYNDPDGDLTDVTDADGGHWSFTYYPGTHLVQTMKRPRQAGVVTNYYDSSHLVTKQTDELNRPTSFDYTSVPGATEITDPQGNVTLQQYQGSELMAVTKGYGTPSAATWSYQYDPTTLGVSTITDPDHHLTSQTWDPASENLATTTDALNRVTVQTWDPAFGVVTSITDAKGVKKTMLYDSSFNLLSVSTPLLDANGRTIATQTTSYTYGQDGYAGDLTTTTDPDGNAWKTGYDGDGDVTSLTDPLGNQTTYAYGSNPGCGSGANRVGFRTSIVTPKGNINGGNPSAYTTTFQYDCFGDPTLTRDPLWNSAQPTQHEVVQQYDADRNLVQTQDGDGNLTAYSYDATDELTVVTRADRSTLKTDYNGDGTVEDEVDGQGNTTRYGYDPLARLTLTTDPDNRTTSVSYDGAGNQLTITDPGGSCTSTPKVGCTTNVYDVANQLTSVTYSDGDTPNVTNIVYDADGQRTSMSDGTGTSAWTFDSLHRLTSSTNGAGSTVQYGYDLTDQLTSIVYPNAGSVSRGYDSAGRLKSVTDWLKNTTSFAYDANSNLIATTFPFTTSTPKLTDSASFDAADRMTGDTFTTQAPGSQNPTTYAAAAYTLDGANLLSSATWTGAIESAQSYQYNQLEQLSTVNSASYAYDAADNLSATASGTHLSYDPAGQLCWTAATAGSSCTTPPSGATTYTYDSRGDRTQQTTSEGQSTTYGYDQVRRLISLSTASVSYAYDGNGLRATRSVGPTTTRFTWDLAEGLPLLLAESTSDAAITYVYGPGRLPIEQVNADGSVTYLHHDQLGSTRLLTDNAGSVTGTYSYDAYGNTTSHTGTGSTRLLFTGQYQDSDSGLYYLRARYYDPSTGQFLSRDPLTLMSGLGPSLAPSAARLGRSGGLLQPYGYAAGDPLNVTDPSGECGLWGNDTCWADIGGFFGHVGDWFGQHWQQVLVTGLGAIALIAGVALTGGSAVLLYAAAQGLDASTFLGFLEGYEFWSHAVWVVGGTGLGTFAAGSYLIYQGANLQGANPQGANLCRQR